MLEVLKLYQILKTNRKSLDKPFVIKIHEEVPEEEKTVKFSTLPILHGFIAKVKNTGTEDEAIKVINKPEYLNRLIIDDDFVDTVQSTYTLAPGEHYVNGEIKRDLTSFIGMFQGCSAITEIEFYKYDVHNITTFGDTGGNGAFAGCSSVTKITGIENWNVSNAVSFGFMFANCYALQGLDLSNWRPYNVRDILGMFIRLRSCWQDNSVKLFPVTGKIRYASQAFSDGPKLLKIPDGWDFSNAENMEGFLSWGRTNSHLDLSNFSCAPQKITNMFYNITSLDISGWDLTRAAAFDRVNNNYNTNFLYDQAYTRPLNLQYIIAEGCSEETLQYLHSRLLLDTTVIYLDKAKTIVYQES